MKKSAVTLLILVFLLPLLHGQKTRFGQNLPQAKPGVDYPLTLHFSGMRIRTECWRHPCADVVYAEAVLNGRKIELESDPGLYLQFFRDMKQPLLGDYRARIISKDPSADVNRIGLSYEMLLPDRSVLNFSVTGVFE